MKQMNAAANVKYTTPPYKMGYFLLRCHRVNLSASSDCEVYSDKTVKASNVRKTLQWSQSLRFWFGAERFSIGYDSADQSHSAGLTKLKVRPLQKDPIRNRKHKQPCVKKAIKEQEWE